MTGETGQNSRYAIEFCRSHTSGRFSPCSSLQRSLRVNYAVTLPGPADSAAQLLSQAAPRRIREAGEQARSSYCRRREWRYQPSAWASQKRKPLTVKQMRHCGTALSMTAVRCADKSSKMLTVRWCDSSRLKHSMIPSPQSSSCVIYQLRTDEVLSEHR